MKIADAEEGLGTGVRRSKKHGSGMDTGRDKAYLRFAPTLDVKEAVWKGGKAGGHRVLQLLSGHCNLAGYLHSRGKRDGAQCDNCGRGETEDMEHYLLYCPQWGAQRQEEMSVTSLFRMTCRQVKYGKHVVEGGGEAGSICEKHGQTGLLERRGGPSSNRGCCAAMAYYGLVFLKVLVVSWKAGAGT